MINCGGSLPACACLGAMTGLVAGLVWSGAPPGRERRACRFRLQAASPGSPAASGLLGVGRRCVLSLTQTPGPADFGRRRVGPGRDRQPDRQGVPDGLRRWMWIVALLLPIVAYLTLTASGIGWDQWGGLQLNLFLTLAGVLFAFPLGHPAGPRSAFVAAGGQEASRSHTSN